ncbi:hypothetical protein F5882DRAFT_508986 [Hyaloscypha sp. PMI_1271]|nr:hypothetical protein F5882DRAFT_508986 [Hyaloscypha sp. PMI_1271]
MFGRSKAAKKQKEKETAARDSALSFPGLSSTLSSRPPLYADLHPLKSPAGAEPASEKPILLTGPVELPAISVQRVPIIVTEPLEETAADDPSCISTWARDRDVVSVRQLESMVDHLPAVTRSTMLDVCEKVRQWMRSPERAHLDSIWDLPSPLGLLPRTSPNRMESLSEEAQATQAGSTRDYTEASQSTSESSPSKKRFSIQILYLNCLQALRAVTIMSIDKDRPNVIYSHLVVWGCGLFQTSTSLDLILEEDDVESVATFKGHLIGVLADIAVLLGMIYEDWTSFLRSYDPIVDPEVQKSLHMLQASFCHFKEFSEAAMGEGPDLPEQAEGIEKRSRELAARMALISSTPVPDRPQRTAPEQRSPIEHEPLARPLGVGFEHDPGLEGTSSTKDGSSVGPGYLPSDYSPYPRDELDFWGQPNEVEFSRKGKEAASGSQKPPHQKPLPLRRGRKAQAHRDPRQISLRDIVTMDLELAAALRLSLVEMQTQESKEKQQDHEVMAQLQEWDAEIQRLKAWSGVFYKSLGTEPSEAEVKRLYSIFEQLARIGATFASSGLEGPKEGSFGVKEVEGKLKMAAEVIARSSGQSIDVKLDASWKSYKEALKTFREANDNIENLG